MTYNTEWLSLLSLSGAAAGYRQWVYANEGADDLTAAGYFDGAPLLTGDTVYDHASGVTYRVRADGSLEANYGEGGPGPDPEPGELDIHSVWTGAVTPDSMRANVQLLAPATVQLVVSTSEDLSSGTLSAPVASQFYQSPTHESLAFHWAVLTAEGLQPDTQYYYGVRDSAGNRTESVGAFRTPPEGAHSFRFGAASCNFTGSDHAVFEEIQSQDLDFFVHMGDFGYPDVVINDPGLFYNNHKTNFGAPRQAALWSSLPLFYIWDDHDFGPNNSWSGSPARAAAIESFRAWVPSPPLADPDPSAGVYFAFDRGRVRFIATDLRAYRADPTMQDSPLKTMLGAAQKTWFKHELLSAKARGQAICWISTIPWNATNDPDGHGGEGDSWSSWGTEQAELADFITEHDLDVQMFVLSGDMHALAYDDGTHAPAGLPVLHAAPLHQSNSTKGGPYTSGPFTTSHAYGRITVDDQGSVVEVRFEAIDATSAPVTRIDQSFTLAPSAPDTNAPVLSDLTLEPIGATSLLGSVRTSAIHGTLYALVSTSSATPSAATVKGEGIPVMVVSETTEVTLTGLTTGVEYFLHVLQEGAAGVASAVLTSEGATPEEAAAPVPIVRFDASDLSSIESSSEDERVSAWHSSGSIPDVVATQGSSARRPLSGVVDIGGANLLRMADPDGGTNQRDLDLPVDDLGGVTLHPDASQAWTVTLAYTSYEVRESGGDRHPLSRGSHFRMSYNADGQHVRVGGSGGTSLVSSAQPVYPVLRVVSVAWDGSHAWAKYDDNTPSEIPIGTGEDTTDALMIGGPWADVAIAQLDIYDHALTANELTALHATIKGKWQV